MVSVIIPNYNHSKYLAQRIDSVLQQTYTNFECIILDDASTDDSLSIIEQFAAADKRIAVLRSEKNSGSPFIQWNKGVQMAKGEYVWIAESDDMAEPDFLETLVNRLKENPAAGLAYSQSYRMNEYGVTTGSWKTWTDALDENMFKEDFTMNGRKYVEHFLLYRNTIPNASAVVFRRQAYLETGGADEQIRNCSDWFCWLKLLIRYDLVFTSRPLNYFRYHKDSVIARAHLPSGGPYEKEFDYEMRRAFNKWLHNNHIDLPAVKKINDRFIFHAIGNFGLYQYRHGKKLKGLQHVLQASWQPGFTFGFIKRLLFQKRNSK